MLISRALRSTIVATVLIAGSLVGVPSALAAGPGQPTIMGAPGLIVGQMGAKGRVPVYISWLPPSSVGAGLASYEFERSNRHCTTYKPLATIPAGTNEATFMLRASRPGTDCVRMRAVDTDGQASDWVYSTVGRLRLVQEDRTSAGANGTRILYSGSWSRLSLTGSAGRAVARSNDSAAEATLEFYGTSIALVTDKMSDHGSFFLTYDTNPVDANPSSVPIDPFSTNGTTQLRSIIWSRNNLGPGLHMLTVQPVGNGPIDIDAFAVVN